MRSAPFFLASALVLMAGCIFNPQPDPPGNNDELQTGTGAGGYKASDAGESSTAAGTGGGVASSGSGGAGGAGASDLDGGAPDAPLDGDADAGCMPGTMGTGGGGGCP